MVSLNDSKTKQQRTGSLQRKNGSGAGSSREPSVLNKNNMNVFLQETKHNLKSNIYGIPDILFYRGLIDASRDNLRMGFPFSMSWNKYPVALYGVTYHFMSSENGGVVPGGSI